MKKIFFLFVTLLCFYSAQEQAIKAWLQGAYSASVSRHKNVTAGWANILKANALNHPYSAAPFNYTGTESVSAGIFNSTAATTDILDWVLVELRTTKPPPPYAATSTANYARAAFILENGFIVDLDGTSNVNFNAYVTVTNGLYYLTIRHRNHLCIRSAVKVQVTGGYLTALYDFTTALSQADDDNPNPNPLLQNASMKQLQTGIFGMWGGDVNQDNQVNYAGLGCCFNPNDAAAMLAKLGGNSATVLSPVYNTGDVNMDGNVRFTGANNDAVFLLSVLGAVSAAVYTGHQ